MKKEVNDKATLINVLNFQFYPIDFKKRRREKSHEVYSLFFHKTLKLYYEKLYYLLKKFYVKYEELFPSFLIGKDKMCKKILKK